MGRPPYSPHPPAPQGLTVLFCKQQEPSIDRANHWRQGLSLPLPLSLCLIHTHTLTYTYRVIDTQWQKIYAVPPVLLLAFALLAEKIGGGSCVWVCVCASTGWGGGGGGGLLLKGVMSNKPRPIQRSEDGTKKKKEKMSLRLALLPSLFLIPHSHHTLSGAAANVESQPLSYKFDPHAG